MAGEDLAERPLAGATFAGRAWSEHRLLRPAYAYEQASNARKPPSGFGQDPDRRDVYFSV